MPDSAKGTLPVAWATLGKGWMDTGKATVFDLFQLHCRYVVPLFQRGYVWNEAGQWKPLWDDLVDQAAAVARNRACPDKPLHKHFLGAVVLSATVPRLRHVPTVEIIDGQQRLTTLQVLLAAIRDETRTFATPFAKSDLLRLTENQGPFVDNNERFKVWPTSALQEDLRNVIDAGSADELEARYGPPKHVFSRRRWRPPRPRLLDAYLFFVARLRDYLDDDPEELPLDLTDLSAEDRTDVLIDALVRNIQLVTIELQQEDDAQVIFETLNARGEPLSPSDLVRNFIFLTATREGAKVDELYRNVWQRFEEDPPPAKEAFWKQDQTQGRLRRSRMDLFLFHYIVFRTTEEVKAGHLYQAFRDWWDEKPAKTVVEELPELVRYSYFYRELLAPNPDTRFGLFAHRLRILDTTTAHPLVLWAAGELGTDSDEFQAMISDIESFFVRRAICGFGQKAYNRLFVEWLKDLRDGNHPSPSRRLRELLASSTADSARWPSDADFAYALQNHGLYRTFRPRPTQMLLEALNAASIGKYTERIPVKDELSVDHVFPQTAFSDTWPLAPRPGESEDEARARQADMAHRLGNLTLLSPPSNSHQSNRPFSQKRDEMRQSLLPLNQYFLSLDHWDEDAIDARGAYLAALALKVWPGP